MAAARMMQRVCRAEIERKEKMRGLPNTFAPGY